jgi:ribose 5-phosphate isomerase A
MGNSITQDEVKKILGHKAASLVQSGMFVGLGTGTTAACFIESLIERCKLGLKITAVASSKHSFEQARAGGIHVVDFDTISSLDLTVDGTDEIDSSNRMIKGGGGALVREKILATSSRQMIVMADESKLVSTLGTKCSLPIEIIPFGIQATLIKIRSMGYQGKMRTHSDGSPYITDNGNYIFDIHSPTGFSNPEKDHERLRSQVGIIETGFFFKLPIRLLLGRKDGTVIID